jgi:chemotaxis-related protein WspB
VSNLFLLFGIGDNRFAMNTNEIVEVLPAVVWTPVPQAPKGVAGLFAYRGQHIPLIDLAELTTGKPAGIRMSTRIVLIRHGRSGKLLGLLAEHVTETLRATDADFSDSGLTMAVAPYLGRIIRHSESVVQHLDIDRLLATSLVEDLLGVNSNV